MYSDAFGLVELPFANAPDPRFFFSTDEHEEALAALVYTVGELKGSILLTGESGTGKSMLIHLMLEHFGNRAVSACVSGSSVRQRTLPEIVCEAFQLDYGPGPSGQRAMTCLHEFLGVQQRRDRPVVLILDDAENLTLRDLDDLRLLSSIQTRIGQALQVVLSGQPDVQERIEHPALVALKRRFFRVARLRPFSRRQTGRYIEHRLTIVGMPEGGKIFADSALDVVFELTRGIPGLINTVADNAMLSAFAHNSTRITAAMLRNCHDLRFHLEARRPPQPEQESTRYTTANPYSLNPSLVPDREAAISQARIITPSTDRSAASNDDPVRRFATLAQRIETNLNRIEQRLTYLERINLERINDIKAGPPASLEAPRPGPNNDTEHAPPAKRSLSATAEHAAQVATDPPAPERLLDDSSAATTTTKPAAKKTACSPPIRNYLTHDLMSRNLDAANTQASRKAPAGSGRGAHPLGAAIVAKPTPETDPAHKNQSDPLTRARAALAAISDQLKRPPPTARVLETAAPPSVE